jgi:hypothetical protein
MATTSKGTREEEKNSAIFACHENNNKKNLACV